jgi:hypothetical protein
VLADWSVDHLNGLAAHVGSVAKSSSHCMKTRTSMKMISRFSRVGGKNNTERSSKKIESEPTCSEGLSRPPDVVFRLPQNGVDAVAAVIEVKLILESEDEDTQFS